MNFLSVQSVGHFQSPLVRNQFSLDLQLAQVFTNNGSEVVIPKQFCVRCKVLLDLNITNLPILKVQADLSTAVHRNWNYGRENKQ